MEQLRQGGPQVSYLVGTPKGRLATIQLLVRRTEPSTDVLLLLTRPNLSLPPPRISPAKTKKAQPM